MTVAQFIYQQIYCRYLCPGECIIHDRGELCNNIAEALAKNFKCEIRVISAGRPQANGQAEAYVKNVKTKMKAIMAASGEEELPDTWDESLLYLALQAVRCDPAISTGYAPAELLLGRPLVWPIEFDKNDVDISGTEPTQPLIDSLRAIHNDAFGKAGEKIKKHQERYAASYDKRHKVNPLALRRNSRIQLLNYSGKKSVHWKKGRMKAEWQPFRSYYHVHSIDRKRASLQCGAKAGGHIKRNIP